MVKRMKIRNYFIVGVLFIAAFVGLSLIGQAIGFWHLPGQAPETEHAENGETATEAAETELHGYMNLKEYLTKNGVDLECVASKLGVTVDEMNVEAREIAHGKGFEMEDIQKMAKECKEAKPQTMDNNQSLASAENQKQDKASEPGKIPEIPNPTNPVKEDKIDIEKLKKELDDKGVKIIEPPTPPDQLPFLKGSDNLKQFCQKNNIDMDCLSSKINVPVEEFDAIAKDIAAKLPSGHVEEIREYLIGCIDYTR
jgi:hypothetical protein